MLINKSKQLNIKPAITAVILLLCFSCVNKAYSNNSLYVEPDSSAKSESPNVCDIGLVSPLSLNSMQHRFTLQNRCKDIVSIEKYKASCGCTSVMLGSSKDAELPYKLLPGDKLDVKVAINPSFLMTGKINKSVTIYLTGQKEPAMELSLSGTIDPDFSCFPTLIDFQKVPAGVDKTAILTLTYNKKLIPGDISPKLTSTDESIQIVDVDKNSKIKETSNTDIVMRTYRLTVNKKQLGNFTGGINILSVDKNDNTPAITLPVIGEVSGELTANPTSLTFDLNKNNVLKQSVIVNALSSVACNKLRVYSDNDAVSAILENVKKNDAIVKTTDDNDFKLSISINRNKVKSTVKANIIILTENGQKLLLPVYIIT